MITFGDLKTRLRSILWPSPTEARNQREAHDLFFKEAMLELGKWVPCLRLNNQSQFDACSTYLQCAKTVVNAPTGIIRRVYTIANGVECDQVFYRQRTFPELEGFARRVSVQWIQPTNEGLAPLPNGLRFHEAVSDSPCGRARIGIYAVHNRRLYLAPWIQSNETIVVEWDGWKRDWSDSDQIDDAEWDGEVEQAIAAFVKWKHEFFYGCDLAKRRDCKMEWGNYLAEAMYWCREQTRLRDVEVLAEDRLPTSDEIKDDVPPDAVEQEVFFANIGDYGSLDDLPGVLNVSTLVKGKEPDFLITNGNNIYGTDYDTNAGQFYASFLYPYSGAYGPGATEQQMFPVPGNYDWAVDGTLNAYKLFFTQTRDYYELVVGLVHFFMLSSDVLEPDGNGPTSKQADWLRAKLALSPAQWKIVVIHNPPYCSETATPGVASSRWDFTGADLILSGHANIYERLEVADLPYIVNGAGGKELGDFTTPVDGSLVRYADDWGAGFCRVTCDSLIYEFYNTAGTLIDTLTLTKDV